MIRIRTQPSLSREFRLIAAFILGIMLLVSVWVVWRGYAYNSERVLNQLESEALRIDRALIVEIENASYILESLSRQIGVMPKPDLEEISALFQSFDRRGYAKNSYFSWGDDRQILVDSSSSGVLAIPVDISSRDYVKKAITKPWEIYIGTPVQNRGSRKWTLPLSIGVTDKKGEYLGVLTLSLDISNLTRDISKAVKEQGISFAITNLSLTLLTQDSADVNYFSRHFDVKRLSTIDFDADPSGVVSQASFWRRDAIFAYYERSGKYPYVIFLGYDPKRNLEALRGVLTPRLLQLSVIAGFLLWVLWDVRRRIIQPVVDLSTVVREIVSGHPPSLKAGEGPVEIAQLHREILRLHQYLHERKLVETGLRAKNSELLRLKEEVRLTNQVKAEFYTQVSQQMREPLEQLRAQAETLKEQHFGPLGNPKYAQHAAAIYALADDVLNDIHLVSEAEAELRKVAETEIDLAALMQKTVRQFKEMEGQNLDLRVEYPPNLPHILADETCLRQLLMRLLQESAAGLAAGDQIRISATDKEAELLLLFTYGHVSEEERRRPASASTALRAPRSQSLAIALARLLAAMHEATLETRTLPDKTFQILVRWPENRILR